jgi:hypothetical protein
VKSKLDLYGRSASQQELFLNNLHFRRAKAE